MPSKNKIIFAAVIIAAVFFIQNSAKKKSDGFAAKIANLGA